MTLDKAIELLRKDLDYMGSVDISDLNESQALGIEALERLQLLRLNFSYLPLRLLPSETKK